MPFTNKKLPFKLKEDVWFIFLKYFPCYFAHLGFGVEIKSDV